MLLVGRLNGSVTSQILGDGSTKFAGGRIHTDWGGGLYLGTAPLDQAPYTNRNTSLNNDGSASFASSVTAASFQWNGSSLTHVDAATLGGISSGQFLRDDTSGTCTAPCMLSLHRITVWLLKTYSHQATTTTTFRLRLELLTVLLVLVFTVLVSPHVGIYTDTSNVLNFDFNSGNVSLHHDAGTLWGSGNDGAGSGLDADLLDGSQGADYLDYNNFTNTPSIPANTSDLVNDSGYDTSTVASDFTITDSAAPTRLLVLSFR